MSPKYFNLNISESTYLRNILAENYKHVHCSVKRPQHFGIQFGYIWQFVSKASQSI